MPGNSKDALRPGHPGKSRGVHGVSDPHATPRTESKWSALSFASPHSHSTDSSPLLFSFLELNLFVGQLTPQQKDNGAVRHALAVQRALAMGNYHKLCQLYIDAPSMGPYIMDHFIDRERVKGLLVMARA